MKITFLKYTTAPIKFSLIYFSSYFSRQQNISNHSTLRNKTRKWNLIKFVRKIPIAIKWRDNSTQNKHTQLHSWSTPWCDEGAFELFNRHPRWVEACLMWTMTKTLECWNQRDLTVRCILIDHYTMHQYR